MIRVAITEAAFEAIAATLPLGSVAYEVDVTVNGEPLVGLSDWPAQKDRSLPRPSSRA